MREEIMKQLRTTYGAGSIVLPRYIKFDKNDKTITLTLPDRKHKSKEEYYGIRGNMQTNEAAFEAWCLAIRQAYPTHMIKLNWREFYQGKKEGHFKRFLYRVFKFKEIFGGSKGWFEVEQGLFSSAEELWINEIKEHSYLNKPEKRNNKSNSSAEALEHKIECLLTNDWNELAKNVGCEKFTKFDRQLPVGLFNKPNGTENDRIFTGGKSAIDLWGVQKETLYLFELKAPSIKMAGIISELFFYTMLILDMLEENIRNCYEEENIEIFKGISTISANFLVDEVHPILNEELVEFLNQAITRYIAQYQEENKIRQVKFEILKYKLDSVVTFPK